MRYILGWVFFLLASTTFFLQQALAYSELDLIANEETAELCAKELL
ncbi:MAG: hypothetical protein JSS07_00705 [Proteobacteria bacterium]|nr:hypothetical protein [Pseudomonadota bacterium]